MLHELLVKERKTCARAIIKILTLYKKRERKQKRKTRGWEIVYNCLFSPGKKKKMVGFIL